MSPASAWALRGRGRSPTRSISPALWRPSACVGAAASGSFFRSALDNCDLPNLTPSRASISVMRREIVQLGRSATGASSRGVTTRSAASVFTGPARAARSPSTPLCHHRRMRCATGEPCPRARRRLPRRAGWSSPTTSAIWPALDPPRRGRATALRFARHAKPRESGRSPTNTCDSLVKPPESA
jgi:hypothetical protein